MMATLVAITALSYGMMRAAPGDPVRAALLSGASDDASRKAGESVAAREFRRRYHLDQPWAVGYWWWLVGNPAPGAGGWLHGEWDPGRWFRGPDGGGTAGPAVPVAGPSLALRPAPPSRVVPAGAADPAGGAAPPPRPPDSVPARGAGWLAAACWRTVAGHPGPGRGGLAQGDLGNSIVMSRGQPVWDVLRQPLGVTLRLQAWSMAVIYLVAVPFGLYSAARRGSLGDRVASFGFFVLYSLPSYWVGLLLILAASRWLPGWPVSGLSSDLPPETGYWARLADAARHYALPVFCLSFGAFASLSRFTRASVLEIIERDFVRTARAKGLGEWTVLTRHVMRNSLITMVTLLAGLLPGLLGGSVVVEYIFSLNGLGSLMQRALASRDYPVLMTDFGLGALLVLAGVLLSDWLYTVVDPRIELDA